MEKVDFVEQRVRECYEYVRENKRKLGLDARDAVEELEPGLAAAAIGYSLVEFDDLGRAPPWEGGYLVAGILDRGNRHIQVSRQFNNVQRRFTAAHELGHLILRHPGEGLHRDRPPYVVGGPSMKRPGIEEEADRFAAVFLMPGELVVEAFERRFGTRKPLEVDETVAFWLGAGDEASVYDAGLDELARKVANYSNRRAVSLSERFRVSPTAMGIRLRELNLV